MKRIFFCLCAFIIICCSCKKNIEVSFEVVEEISVFAVKSSTNKLEEVVIEYTLENEEDLFILYTSLQNTLPIGYTSPANPNITLISSEVKNKVVYYTVDNYILLSDIPTFHEALTRTGKLLNYKKIHIILNENQLI